MCGKEYPLKTMADKPPRQDYGTRSPTKVSPELEALREEAKKANEAGDYAALKEIETKIRELERKEIAEKGIAAVFSPVSVKKPMTGKGTRRNKTSGGGLVTSLLTIRNQIKLYHWQTGSFARHKATDDLTATLDTLIDSFVESYMGRYGRPKVSGSIRLHNFSELAARGFVAQQTKFLTKELPQKIGRNDTDLLNIRDEILGELNKVLYLFTLA